MSTTDRDALLAVAPDGERGVGGRSRAGPGRANPATRRPPAHHPSHPFKNWQACGYRADRSGPGAAGGRRWE